MKLWMIRHFIRSLTIGFTVGIISHLIFQLITFDNDFTQLISMLIGFLAANFSLPFLNATREDVFETLSIREWQDTDAIRHKILKNKGLYTHGCMTVNLSSIERNLNAMCNEGVVERDIYPLRNLGDKPSDYIEKFRLKSDDGDGGRRTQKPRTPRSKTGCKVISISRTPQRAA